MPLEFSIGRYLTSGRTEVRRPIKTGIPENSGYAEIAFLSQLKWRIRQDIATSQFFHDRLQLPRRER